LPYQAVEFFKYVQVKLGGNKEKIRVQNYLCCQVTPKNF
jgi:hypothetical protein